MTHVSFNFHNMCWWCVPDKRTKQYGNVNNELRPGIRHIVRCVAWHLIDRIPVGYPWIFIRYPTDIRCWTCLISRWDLLRVQMVICRRVIGPSLHGRTRGRYLGRCVTTSYTTERAASKWPISTRLRAWLCITRRQITIWTRYSCLLVLGEWKIKTWPLNLPFDEFPFSARRSRTSDAAFLP